MIGSNGPRMLRIAAPHVQAWNTWFADTGNDPDGVARLRDVVDDACRDVGRDPAEIERTVAVLVQLPERNGSDPGRLRQARSRPRSRARQTSMADALRAYAERASATSSS